jgi:selenophosphate synthase
MAKSHESAPLLTSLCYGGGCGCKIAPGLLAELLKRSTPTTPFALASLGMPIKVLPDEVIRQVLRGREAMCAQAGISIAGGHSIDSLEPIYGLAAVGVVHPQHVKCNSGARAGDALILGTPLGVGIL